MSRLAPYPRVPPSLVAPLGIAEAGRMATCKATARDQKSALGQFWTPWQTASLMAEMAGDWGTVVRVLDPGAGAGALTAAWVERMLISPKLPEEVRITTYEVDQEVIPYLAGTLTACVARLEAEGVKVGLETRTTDFIEDSVARLERGLFSKPEEGFDLVLMNPPYKKLGATSSARRRLSSIGIEVTNLYSAFVSLALRQLGEGGRMVAITPRSFCNGPYFRSFRNELLDTLALTQIQLFDSRAEAFKEDSVLQENVIFAGTKSAHAPSHVAVTLSAGPADAAPVTKRVPLEAIVHPGDAERFIHLPVGLVTEGAAEAMQQQPARLADLGVSVSTGRVVDFRVRDDWSSTPGKGTVPLLYAAHFVRGRLAWPKAEFKKPNALRLSPSSEPWLIPNGAYVLVKRFSSKEEKRRVVAYLLAPDDLPAKRIGIENHLNYLHSDGEPLNLELAAGLTCFLNSGPVDRYFRSFNGHTQVNAGDLRALRYPSVERLTGIGKRWLKEGRPFETAGPLGEEFFQEWR